MRTFVCSSNKVAFALMAHAINVSWEMRIQLFIATAPPALNYEKPFSKNPIANVGFYSGHDPGLRLLQSAGNDRTANLVTWNWRSVVVFSNLRQGLETFGPTRQSSHIRHWAHYLFGNIFQRYEFRYRFCFGHLGAHLGDPISNQAVDGDGFHFQRFEGGTIFIEEADIPEVPPISAEDGFRWKP